MKKLLSTMTAVAAMGMVCSPAMATDPTPVTQTIEFSASVTDAVTLPTPSVTSASENVIVTPGSTSTVSISSIATEALTPIPTNIIMQYSGIVTNYPTTITLTSTKTGIKDETVTQTQTGYTNTINYTATASISGGSDLVTLDTSSSPSGQSATQEPFSGDIVLVIDIPAASGTDKLFPGSYSDTLTMRIGSPI